MKRRHSAQTRDAALRRLGRANRWLIAGSLALTAVLAEVAAQAFPGKSLHGSSTSGTTGRSANPRGSGTGSPTGSANSVELHPPAQAPESAPEEESAPPAESSSQEPAGGAQPSEQEPAPAQQQPQRSESSPPVVSGGSWAARSAPLNRPARVGELDCAGHRHRAAGDRARGPRTGAGGGRARAGRDRPRVQPLPRGLRAHALERSLRPAGSRGPAAGRRARDRPRRGQAHVRRRRSDYRPGARARRLRPRLARACRAWVRASGAWARAGGAWARAGGAWARAGRARDGHRSRAAGMAAGARGSRRLHYSRPGRSAHRPGSDCQSVGSGSCGAGSDSQLEPEQARSSRADRQSAALPAEASSVCRQRSQFSRCSMN